MFFLLTPTDRRPDRSQPSPEVGRLTDRGATGLPDIQSTCREIIK
jgi:hypothetical protein